MTTSWQEIVTFYFFFLPLIEFKLCYVSLLCIFLVVGGPLRFPDLTDSFLETEQSLTEVLLSKLQQELSEYQIY